MPPRPNTNGPSGGSLRNDPSPRGSPVVRTSAVSASAPIAQRRLGLLGIAPRTRLGQLGQARGDARLSTKCAATKRPSRRRAFLNGLSYRTLQVQLMWSEVALIKGAASHAIIDFASGGRVFGLPPALTAAPILSRVSLSPVH